MTSCQKRIRELSRALSEITVDHEIEVSKGNHLKVVIHCCGEQRTLFSSKTPSDHRSIMNFTAKVKRTYREMETLRAPLL